MGMLSLLFFGVGAIGYRGNEPVFGLLFVPWLLAACFGWLGVWGGCLFVWIVDVSVFVMLC